MKNLPDRHLKELVKIAKQARALNGQLNGEEKLALPHDEQVKMILAYLRNVQLIAAALLKSAKHIQDTSSQD